MLDIARAEAPAPHWHSPREVRTAAALMLLTIAVGWLGGQVAALVLLNERLLLALGIS